VLGIPNIIAFLTKHDLDDESKSLSASLLISIGSAAPVYASFAKHHGVFEALCSWARSTDNERHHFKIQVLASRARVAVIPRTLTRCGFQNCFQLFARQHSSQEATVAPEENAVLLLLHVCHNDGFQG
jgi:ethanolamine utilization protein EutP (predicted NTPase)